ARLGAHNDVARVVALRLQVVVELILVVQHVTDLGRAFLGLLEVGQLPRDHFPAVGAFDGDDVTHAKPFRSAAGAAGPKCSRTVALSRAPASDRVMPGPRRGTKNPGNCEPRRDAAGCPLSRA